MCVCVYTIFFRNDQELDLINNEAPNVDKDNISITKGMVIIEEECDRMNNSKLKKVCSN